MSTGNSQLIITFFLFLFSFMSADSIVRLDIFVEMVAPSAIYLSYSTLL